MSWIAHVVIVQKIPHSSPASFFTVPVFPLSLFSMFHFFFALAVSLSLLVPVLVTSCTGYCGGSLDVTSYCELAFLCRFVGRKKCDGLRRADGQFQRSPGYEPYCRPDGRQITIDQLGRWFPGTQLTDLLRFAPVQSPAIDNLSK